MVSFHDFPCRKFPHVAKADGKDGFLSVEKRERPSGFRLDPQKPVIRNLVLELPVSASVLEFESEKSVSFHDREIGDRVVGCVGGRGRFRPLGEFRPHIIASSHFVGQRNDRRVLFPDYRVEGVRHEIAQKEPVFEIGTR